MISARWAAVAIALLLGSSSASLAQSDTTKVDVSGNWSFTVVYEGGQGSPTVRLTQRGDSLTGRYISQTFGEIDFKGAIKGRDFEFWVTTQAGGDPFTMTFAGTVEGANNLKGTVELGGNGNATFTAVRQRNPEPARSP